MNIGAQVLGDGRCEFVVWAPFLEWVAVRVLSPREQMVLMDRDRRGYWRVTLDDVKPGSRYVYRIGPTTDRPDPASDSQPDGVHQPSEVVDHSTFPWEDHEWMGVPLEDMILYELHVGTFTPEGTFDAVIPRLSDLRDLGVTAIELMPVAQFPGNRNWGYDGVHPFAVHNSYGGPEGLKRLVSACHTQGLAVVLDVVYNHLGPEGNYLAEFAPYFTDRVRTPWGRAINFDDGYSDDVRNFFIENALQWFQRYHFDALRLDAIHAIADTSPKPFLQELSEVTEEFSHQQGRKYYLIAESNLNDARVIRPRDLGGFGMDAQWCDDFHHSLRWALTGETSGYFVDFGRFGHLIKAFKEGFVYSWQYSEYRKRRHGSSAADRPGCQFVVFSQNHDQVGNRMLGERLTRLVSFEALKLAAGTVLLAPYLPLIFMGEEYAEPAPFLYFVSHGDPALIEAVRAGRREEFQSFQWQGEPPDPQDPNTFLQAKLSWQRRSEGAHRVLWEFYRTLIRLRRETPALRHPDRDAMDIRGAEDSRVLWFRRWNEREQVLCTMNFSPVDASIVPAVPQATWRRIIDSAAPQWLGPGSLLRDHLMSGDKVNLRPWSFAVFTVEEETRG